MIVIIHVLSFCFALSACQRIEPDAGSSEVAKPEKETETEKEPEEAKNVNLPTVRVTRALIPQTMEFPGKIAALPDRSVQVTPNIAGKITRVLVVPGQNVVKGQAIAILDSQELNAQMRQAIAPEQSALNQVSQAKINEDLAKKNLDRIQALFEKDISPEKDVIAAQSQLDLAKAQVEAAKAKVAEARIAPAHLKTQLAFMTVRSPLTGVVAQRFLNVGDTADPNKPIVHIVNLQDVIVNADMPADSTADPAVGQKATITTIAEENTKFIGKITAISPVVNSQGNTVPIQVQCHNQANKLKEGQTATVTIDVGARHAVTVPESALVPGDEDPSEHMVYIVRDGKLARTKVVVGAEINGRIAILKGLNDGDEIVTSGAYGIPDGTLLDRGSERK